MNIDLKCEHKDRIRLDLVAGSPNYAVTLGEDPCRRITDSKLYGFGYTIYSLCISRDRLSHLIEGKEEVTLRFIGYGKYGVYLDDVRISANGKKSDYDAYFQNKKNERKLLDKRWSRKRKNNYYDNTWFVVKTENIKEVLEII